MDKSRPSGDLVDQVIARVLKSTKYSTISEDLIRRVATQETNKRAKLQEAVKSTKNKLHQVGGAYFENPVDYCRCLEDLKAAYSRGKVDFYQACRRVMCYHSSTRERLPELDRFYHTLLTDLPPARRIFDIACGLNPLAVPWMGLSEDVEYFAVDIYADLIDFLNQYMAIAGVRGSAIVGDVIGNIPTHEVDIAFVLKTIPCLEQVDKSVGMRLLDNINAEHIIVSFPVHSLGGRRDKGMLENYASRFNEIVVHRSWSVKRYEFITELVFVVSKPK
jgi:16S rRNA (guanine(1405)-N(7))-methyltransferase